MSTLSLKIKYLTCTFVRGCFILKSTTGSSVCCRVCSVLAVAPRSPAWIYIPWFPWDWKEEGVEHFRNWGNSLKRRNLTNLQLFFPALGPLAPPNLRLLNRLRHFPSQRLSHGITSLLWRSFYLFIFFSEKSGNSLSWTRFEGLWPWPGVVVVVAAAAAAEEAAVGFLRWGPHRRCGITGTWVERRPRSCSPEPGETAASWCGTARVSTGLTLCVYCK